MRYITIFILWNLSALPLLFCSFIFFNREGLLLCEAALVLVILGLFRWGGHLVLTLVGGQYACRFQYQQLYEIMDHYCYKLKLGPPRIIILKNFPLNIFSLGQFGGSSMIFFHEDLLKIFHEGELRAAMAYSLACIKNKDTFSKMIGVILGMGFLWPLLTIQKILGLFLKDGPKALLQTLLGMVLHFFLGPLSLLFMKTLTPKKMVCKNDKLAVSICNDSVSLISAIRKILNENHKENFLQKFLGPLCLVDAIFEKSLVPLFEIVPAVEERFEKLRNYPP